MANRILVTGLIRSGTTWVGRMLATARQTVYIHEPFNPDANWNAAVPTPRKHFYLHEGNGGPWKPLVENLLRFEPTYPQSWAKEPKERCEAIISTGVKNWGDRENLIPIVKDPTALLSTEWLVDEFNLTPVVVTRQPVLIAKSLLKLGWSADVRQALQRQPTATQLLEDGEAEFLIRSADGTTDLVERTCLFVRYLSNIVAGYQKHHPDWLFVAHEDLVANPREGFDDLFRSLALAKSDRTHSALQNEGDYNSDQVHQSTLNPISMRTNVFDADEHSSAWAELNERYFEMQQPTLSPPAPPKPKPTYSFLNEHQTVPASSLSDSSSFLILSPSRSGSTMLRKLLDQHPDACCHGELLTRFRKGSTSSGGSSLLLDEEKAKTLLEEDHTSFALDAVLQSPQLATGVKILFRDVQNPEFADLFEKLFSDSSVKVLFLWRRNLVARFLSEVRHRNKVRASKISVTPREIQRDAANQIALKKLILQRLQPKERLFNKNNHSIHFIDFDQLISEPEETLNQIFAFLELPVFTVDASIKTASSKAVDQIGSVEDFLVADPSLPVYLDAE